MNYEQELALLIEKLNYWTPEKMKEFYSGHNPLSTKYGEEWGQVWEDTDLGSIIIFKKLRKFREITLYGNDGKFYRLNESFGEQDWNIWRDLYVTAHETGAFRIEVPFYHEQVPYNGTQWMFTVSTSPGGSKGTNIYDAWMESTDGNEFINQLILDIESFAKHLNTISERYGAGMSPHLFCPASRWKNESGWYFMAPGNYTMEYNEAANLGVALFKVAQGKKFNLFSDLYSQADATEINFNEYIDSVKQRWKV